MIHKLLACTVLFITLQSLHAQQLQDNRMVGVLSFSTNNFSDSIAAKNIHAAVSRVMIQTKRFTVLDMNKWKLTQDEIERQRSAGFLQRDIIKRGKSLGAHVLIVGFVKNAEVYQVGSNYAARIDYELTYVDVETGKSIAAQTFTGDSEKMAISAGGAVKKGLEQMAVPALFSTRKGYKTLAVSSAALHALSETEKKAVKGKTIDAIEESVTRLNAWIHKTFNFNLFLLQTMDEDKKKGFQSVLVEGGEDIGMKKGYRLKMVLVTEMETSRGRIRDEEPVAELEVEEVRAQTSKCKVLSGGKKIQEVAQNKSMRIVFN